jgi:hypothetical protein
MNYRAVYNPDNQQVMIPLVTVISTDVGYSVVLQYHVADQRYVLVAFGLVVL